MALLDLPGSVERPGRAGQPYLQTIGQQSEYVGDLGFDARLAAEGRSYERLSLRRAELIAPSDTPSSRAT
jgi:hypothetical protein